MPECAAAAGRLVLAAVSFAALTGFAEIRDEAIVSVDGTATARRTVRSAEAEPLEQLLEQLREVKLAPRRPEGEPPTGDAFRKYVCDTLTAHPRAWGSCRFEGTALLLEKTWPRDQSPFSTVERGRASFALHHWLASDITRPAFPLLGIGPISVDDAGHRAFIDDLRRGGHVLQLTVRMPGAVTRLWGRPGRGTSDTVVIDLLQPWPQEQQETFIESDTGILRARWFQGLVLTVLLIVAMLWMRRMRRR